MNPFAGIFKRGPDPIRLSDWLENMKERFVKIGDETLSKDKSSQEMLVCFTLLNTTVSAYNLLHNTSSIASRIGTVYGELRAYFDCLWYLCLLSQYESSEDIDKISKLHASVSLRLENTLTSLFCQNPDIKRCMESAYGESYIGLFHAAVKEYIYGERKNSKHDTGDLLNDNVQALSSTLQRATRLARRDRESVVNIMREETEKALHLKFLTQFEFSNCKFLDLPDSCYREIPSYASRV
jgi:hypothetical protein